MSKRPNGKRKDDNLEQTKEQAFLLTRTGAVEDGIVAWKLLSCIAREKVEDGSWIARGLNGRSNWSLNNTLNRVLRLHSTPLGNIPSSIICGPATC
jgi:hypothetical protein